MAAKYMATMPAVMLWITRSVANAAMKGTIIDL